MYNQIRVGIWEGGQCNWVNRLDWNSAVKYLNVAAQFYLYLAIACIYVSVCSQPDVLALFVC